MFNLIKVLTIWYCCRGWPVVSLAPWEICTLFHWRSIYRCTAIHWERCTTDVNDTSCKFAEAWFLLIFPLASMILKMKLEIFFITNNLNCANGITARLRGRKFMNNNEVKYCSALEQSTQLTFLRFETLRVFSDFRSPEIDSQSQLSGIIYSESILRRLQIRAL